MFYYDLSAVKDGGRILGDGSGGWAGWWVGGEFMEGRLSYGISFSTFVSRRAIVDVY